MKTLSAKPVAAEYEANYHKEAKLGRQTVYVFTHRNEGRQGSYERGFKFTTVIYGMLTRKETPAEAAKRENRRTRPAQHRRTLYSANHGVTWHLDPKEARRAKGKFIMSKDKHKEFAFDGIQEINRKWEGPGYRWHP